MRKTGPKINLDKSRIGDYHVKAVIHLKKR
jgi:hypothetical protein